MAEGAKMDLQAHEHTYARFIGLAKVGTIAVAIIAAIVVLLIAH